MTEEQRKDLLEKIFVITHRYGSLSDDDCELVNSVTMRLSRREQLDQREIDGIIRVWKQ